MFPLPHKTKQFFFVLIKISIVLAAFYFIYDKLTNQNTLIFSDFSIHSGVFSIKTICFIIILSFFNWFFEILKWKILISSIKKIKLNEATAQCLGALTTSLFTPNRIGEYGAKALFYKTGKRKKVMFINLIGNMQQMAVTVFFGCIGHYFFSKMYHPKMDYINVGSFSLIALGMLILTPLILTKCNGPFKNQTIARAFQFAKNYSKSLFGIGTLLSALRYLIFSFQFYVLLKLYGTDLTYVQAMVIISSMYLLASVIPSISVFDVLIKGSVAVYLFSFAGVNELIILSIVSLMWGFNFALPSILGSYYVLNFKLPKKRLTT